MYGWFIVIDAISLVLQVAVAIMAIRMIRITGSNRAWIVIAVAMLAMVVRRVAVLTGILVAPETVDIPELWSDAIGLLNALLLLVGIALIAPLFRAIQQAKETIERSRDQLEREVAQRTAELVQARDELQKELAQRARAEEALRDEHSRLLGVLEMGEQDQRLLAYEIHDGFVQPATAALMNLQAGLATHAADPQQAMEDIERGLQLLQDSIAQVRRLIGGLRPIVLEDEGLVAAIDKLVRDSDSRTAIKIDWSHHVEFERLAPSLEKSFFRIIQEAFRNALNHSGSDRIEIALTQSDKTVVATIQDWGCGFDATADKPGHFGMEGMRERARLFGGSVQIQSATGKGTLVTVEFPLAEKPL